MIIKHTQRPYFKKYFKKIVVISKKYKNMKKSSVFDSKKSKISISCLQESKKCKDYVINLEKSSNIDFSYYIRNRVGKIIFYYNDNYLEDIIDKNNFEIIEKFLPINERQVIIQKNEMNTICRKTYFFNKYKYKLEMKLSEKRIYQTGFKKEVKNNIKEIRKTLNDLFENKKSDAFLIKETKYGINLFLSDEETAFYLKILYDDFIKKSLYIILESDI